MSDWVDSGGDPNRMSRSRVTAKVLDSWVKSYWVWNEELEGDEETNELLLSDEPEVNDRMVWGENEAWLILRPEWSKGVMVLSLEMFIFDRIKVWLGMT